jgi:hypothetical protein
MAQHHHASDLTPAAAATFEHRGLHLVEKKIEHVIPAHVEYETVLLVEGDEHELRRIRDEIKRICLESVRGHCDPTALGAAEQRILAMFGENRQ